MNASSFASQTPENEQQQRLFMERSWVLREVEGGEEGGDSKTLFYKDCSFGSV